MPATILALRPVATLREKHAKAGTAYRFALSPVGGVTKRLFDLTSATLALMFLAPLLLLIAALIILEGAGPVLFLQRRAGFRGRVFTIYKFRSMHTSDDGRGIVQACADDTRVTRLGRFLRRSSLDELPQLLNVLRGDMSIVGPRPHALSHENQFRHISLRYGDRRTARPGITGLAQVSGARGQTETPEKIARRLACDLAYVNNWSIWLDLLIIMRTVGTVLRDRSAV